MSDRGKTAIALFLVAGIILAVIFFFAADNKNFGKVIQQYKSQGKEHQANPEDIRKGFE